MKKINLLFIGALLSTMLFGQNVSLEIEHNDLSGHALDIDVININNPNAAIWLKNQTLGMGFDFQMLNGTSTSTGLSINNVGLGMGLKVSLNNVSSSNPAISSTTIGTGPGILGGTGTTTAQGVLGTNIYDATNWYSLDEGSASSGIQGATKDGIAGITGYVWKKDLPSSSLANTQGGYFATAYGASATTYSSARISYVDAGGTPRKIDGSGAAGTIIKDLENKPRLMSAVEAPEILFQDYGMGKLNYGKSIIILDEIFSKNIVVDENNPMKVFIQLEGECNGVYVTNKTIDSFEVIELNGGHSNVSFSYQVIANRANIEQDGNMIFFDSRKRFEAGPENLPLKIINHGNNF